MFDFPPTFFLPLLALVLHHHFRLTRSFGMDSDIVSQHCIPTLKVYLGNIVEFRWALMERIVDRYNSYALVIIMRRFLCISHDYANY